MNIENTKEKIMSQNVDSFSRDGAKKISGVLVGLRNVPKTQVEFNRDLEALLNNRDNNRISDDGAAIRASYGEVLKRYSRLVDESNNIIRLQRIGHTQAIVARFLTTLAIGAGVLLTYFVAGFLEIPLPMMGLK